MILNFTNNTEGASRRQVFFPLFFLLLLGWALEGEEVFDINQTHNFTAGVGRKGKGLAFLLEG